MGIDDSTIFIYSLEAILSLLKVPMVLSHTVCPALVKDLLRIKREIADLKRMYSTLRGGMGK